MIANASPNFSQDGGFVEQIMKRYETLKSNRVNWESNWQEIARYILPRRADFETERSAGEERRQYIFDSTPVRALTRFASGLHNMMTNSALRWFQIQTENKELNEYRPIQLWLEECTVRLGEAFNRPSSNFHPAIFEYYTDLGAFGTAVLFIQDRIGEGPYYQCFPLSDCYLASDYYGKIDTIFRISRHSAKELAEIYPPEVLSEKVQKCLEQGKLFEQFKCMHAVFPHPNPDIEKGDKPFISTYCLLDEKHLLSVGGFDEFPYVCSRWNRNALETYGRGPGFEALPDIRMLNEMEKTFLKALQKMVSPPLMLPDDGFLAPIRTTPDALNYYRTGLTGNEMVQPFPVANRPEYADAKMGQVREAIDKAFFLDLMELPGPVAADGDVLRFTATEIAMRQRDRLTILGPIVSRQEIELLGPIVERTMHVMIRSGMLPEPPQEVMGMNFRIEYTNPVSISMRSGDLTSVSQLFQFMLPMAQIDPTVIERFNTHRIAELGAEILKTPPSVLKTQEEMEEMMRQRQEEQAMQMQMQQQMAASEVQGNIADAEQKRTQAGLNIARAESEAA